MKQENIKVVVVVPDQPAKVQVIENKLEVLQRLVGGYIEVLKEDGFDIIFNEEGKLLDLEPNFALNNGDYIAGAAVFAGVDYAEGEFKSLSEAQIKAICKVFEGRQEI
jgi:uncharacterized protein DUF3846